MIGADVHTSIARRTTKLLAALAAAVRVTPCLLQRGALETAAPTSPPSTNPSQTVWAASPPACVLPDAASQPGLLRTCAVDLLHGRLEQDPLTPALAFLTTCRWASTRPGTDPGQPGWPTALRRQRRPTVSLLKRPALEEATSRVQKRMRPSLSICRWRRVHLFEPHHSRIWFGLASVGPSGLRPAAAEPSAQQRPPGKAAEPPLSLSLRQSLGS